VFLAPEWLVRATPAIALFAMLISLASFFLTLKTYRRAGARVRVRYEVGTATDNRLKKEVPAIVIEVTNSGMAGMEVKNFLLRPPTIIGFLRIGPCLLFEEDSEHGDVERLSGKKLPVTIPPNRTLDWAYRIKSAGVAGGWWRAEESSLVTDLSEIYQRMRKSKIEVGLGDGHTLKQLHLTYGAMISLGEYEEKKSRD